MMLVPRAKAPAIFHRVTAYPATIGSIVATVTARGFMSISIFATRPLMFSSFALVSR
jgi:hypothetical protein